MATETERFVGNQVQVNTALLEGQQAILRLLAKSEERWEEQAQANKALFKHWEAQHEANSAILTSLKLVSTRLEIIDKRLERMEQRS